MTLTQRLTKYILSHPNVTLDGLVKIATSKGFTEGEVYAALDTVHRDKRITQSTKGGEVVYRPAVAKASSPTPHLDWLRHNYPYPDNFIMPFPEIDYSWIVMSPDEAKEYKAAAKGMPLYMIKKQRL